MGKSRSGRILVLVLGILSVVSLGFVVLAVDYYQGYPEGAKARYVGRQTCIECHQDEAALFAGSHHDLAMGHATDESVLGDFNNVTFEHHGITSRLYRDGQRFMIYTEGPDGKMADFEIKYFFGVEPLQQYMVEFGRTADMQENELPQVQVLRISWDTKRKEWFYLNPPDVNEKLDPTDDLHWTGITQRWNTMCAECHSTNLKKNYDPHTQTYRTTFSEIDVSCEACHGPGSLHVEMANSRSLFWDRHLGYGLAKLKGDNHVAQIEACAPCHSRRSMLAEGFHAGDAYCDFFDPATLDQSLYHDDGQILDEVYVYGSFTQSKMYHKGIRCSDCHDPHSLQLKAPGNQVCTSCHQHPAGKYDTPAHHKHVPGKLGSACVDCHMPERTYMEVDPRRDHSLRIPRPDLSLTTGAPNACTGCHLKPEAIAEEKREKLKEYADWQLLASQGDLEVIAEIDRTNQWCEEACQKWYGSERKQAGHFATDFAAFRRDMTGSVETVNSLAADRLGALAKDSSSVAALARATALNELSSVGDSYAAEVGVKAARATLDDSSPIVRAAAIKALANEANSSEGVRQLATRLGELLDDPVRLVRTTAAKVLATTQAHNYLRDGRVIRFQQVIDEIYVGMEALDDRSGAHMEWALLCESLGRLSDAVEAYRKAILVQPRMVGPRSNLATLLERMVEAQTNVSSADAAQVQKTRDTITALRKQELPLLERDASLVPNNAMIQYRLGLSYYLNGRYNDALTKLQHACELEPGNEDFSLALQLLQEKASQPK